MKKPMYITPDGAVCPACGEPCAIVPLLNDFDYSGTHCTGGRSGTHYPDGWGSPVSDCCEASMEDAECYEPDYDEYFDDGEK